MLRISRPPEGNAPILVPRYLKRPEILWFSEFDLPTPNSEKLFAMKYASKYESNLAWISIPVYWQGKKTIFQARKLVTAIFRASCVNFRRARWFNEPICSSFEPATITIKPGNDLEGHERKERGTKPQKWDRATFIFLAFGANLSFQITSLFRSLAMRIERRHPSSFSKSVFLRWFGFGIWDCDLIRAALFSRSLLKLLILGFWDVSQRTYVKTRQEDEP